MIKPYNIAKKIAPALISLCLALCLIFSSFSAYTAEIFFSDNSTETTFSVTQLEQGYVHHTTTSKSEFLAEISDNEEDDDFSYKNKTNLLSTILRTLWSYSYVEADNLSAVQHAETPVVKIAEHYYIEYCSLKIPS